MCLCSGDRDYHSELISFIGRGTTHPLSVQAAVWDTVLSALWGEMVFAVQEVSGV